MHLMADDIGDFIISITNFKTETSFENCDTEFGKPNSRPRWRLNVIKTENWFIEMGKIRENASSKFQSSRTIHGLL